MQNNLITKEIYFIRHGQTQWNKLGIGQGSRNDIPMNDVGKEQAEITGLYLNEYRQLDKKFDLVLSSPLIRAKETAEIISKKIDFDINQIIYLDQLKEVDAGLLYTGKTNKEMQNDSFYDKYFELMENEFNKIEDPIQELIEYWSNDDALSKHYEMESHDDLSLRFAQVFNYIEKSDKSKILVISHGEAIINGVGSYFNLKSLKGDFEYGSNCHITYIVQKNQKLELLYGPSTDHFRIYNKDYSC